MRQGDVIRRNRRAGPLVQVPSAFTGFRFPPEVILRAVRWYLRYGLSYRDLEEILVDRGIDVDRVTLFRWVQRFTPLLIDAARPCRHAVGDRWFVDETDGKSTASGDARTQNRPNGQRRDPRARLRPERPPRPLRAWCRSLAGVPAGGCLRRTPTRDLNSSTSAHDPARPTIA